MKILVTVKQNSLDTSLDEHFGRCNWFAIYETEEERLLFVPNPGCQLASGAGKTAAQKALDLEVDEIHTGHVGPKAAEVLKEFGLPAVETDTNRTLNDFIESLKKNIQA